MEQLMDFYFEVQLSDGSIGRVIKINIDRPGFCEVDCGDAGKKQLCVNQFEPTGEMNLIEVVWNFGLVKHGPTLAKQITTLAQRKQVNEALWLYVTARLLEKWDHSSEREARSALVAARVSDPDREFNRLYKERKNNALIALPRERINNSLPSNDTESTASMIVSHLANGNLDEADRVFFRAKPSISIGWYQPRRNRAEIRTVHPTQHPVVNPTTRHVQPNVNEFSAQDSDTKKTTNDHTGQIVQRKAQEVQSLNESRQFDLLIFDLDDTLLATGHLDAFRGKEYIGPQSDQYKNELAIHARTLEQLVPEALLLSLQADFPSLALSIFTRAPREYAAILLEARFPKMKWSSIVAFEDVARTKPHPDGIYLAAKLAGVNSLNRVALVGDGKTDVLTAYQAGIQVVLLTTGWGPNWASKGNPNRSDHFKTLNLMPDAKIATANDLFNFVTRPVSLLPCLEAWDADPTFSQSPESMRVDMHNHFNNLDDAGHPNWVETHALGRYFPSLTSLGWYDFSRREAHHLVTKAILDAKDGIPYPESWAECCANYIYGYAADMARKNRSLLVCSIPSSSGTIRPLGRDRLVDFCKAIEIQLQGRCKAVFNCAILQYDPGACSNKTLDRDARFANVRDHMFVVEASDVRGMAVLVIDDVSTSGATFFYAARYLTQAGAYSVRCLALTQTIS
jgi:beta-phosphoglucomutase-like phosphatase (HAD superfamily)